MVGVFEFLLLLSVFLFVQLYLALIVGVLILRKREPDAERETALYAVAMVAESRSVYQYRASR